MFRTSPAIRRQIAPRLARVWARSPASGPCHGEETVSGGRRSNRRHRVDPCSRGAAHGHTTAGMPPGVCEACRAFRAWVAQRAAGPSLTTHTPRNYEGHRQRGGAQAQALCGPSSAASRAQERSRAPLPRCARAHWRPCCPPGPRRPARCPRRPPPPRPASAHVRRPVHPTDERAARRKLVDRLRFADFMFFCCGPPRCSKVFRCVCLVQPPAVNLPSGCLVAYQGSFCPSLLSGHMPGARAPIQFNKPTEAGGESVKRSGVRWVSSNSNVRRTLLREASRSPPATVRSSSVLRGSHVFQPKTGREKSRDMGRRWRPRARNRQPRAASTPAGVEPDLARLRRPSGPWRDRPTVRKAWPWTTFACDTPVY